MRSAVIRASPRTERHRIYLLVQAPPLQATGSAEAEEPANALRLRSDERASDAWCLRMGRVFRCPGGGTGTSSANTALPATCAWGSGDQAVEVRSGLIREDTCRRLCLV